MAGSIPAGNTRERRGVCRPMPDTAIPSHLRRGAVQRMLAACDFCEDWASRSFTDGVADASSGSAFALARALTWCPGCGDHIPADLAQRRR